MKDREIPSTHLENCTGKEEKTKSEESEKKRKRRLKFT